MNEQEFQKQVKKAVVEYANTHLDKSDNKQITEDDVFIVHIRADIGLCYDRLFALMRKIVAVKADIHTTAGNLGIFDLLNVIADALGYGRSPSADTDENHVVDALVLFGYLVGYSHKCAAHCRLIHKSCLELHIITPNKRKSPCRKPTRRTRT